MRAEDAPRPVGFNAAPLHVTNGDSAGNTLRQTALGGAVLPWQDVLHEGPVPAGPRRELLQARAAFLSACGWGSSRSILASLEDRDRQLVQALKDGQQVVLWFEHDLYDQLQLVDALAQAAPETPHTPELVVVGSFPGKAAFRGLGELTADELETLWPARVPASQDTLAAAVSVWAALRHPDPSALAAAARADHPGLPFLGPALLRLLEELPAPGDGLSGTERRALQAIAAGAATPAAAFLAEQDLETAPFLGDAWFFRVLAGLVPARPGWSRRRPATRSRRPRRWATPAPSPGCRSGSPTPASGSWTAGMTGSRCSAWTAGWAALTSPRPPPGAGTRPTAFSSGPPDRTLARCIRTGPRCLYPDRNILQARQVRTHDSSDPGRSGSDSGSGSGPESGSGSRPGTGPECRHG